MLFLPLLYVNYCFALNLKISTAGNLGILLISHRHLDRTAENSRSRRPQQWPYSLQNKRRLVSHLFVMRKRAVRLEHFGRLWWPRLESSRDRHAMYVMIIIRLQMHLLIAWTGCLLYLRYVTP